MIIRSIFFKEITSLILKDPRRNFNEYERIMIYRRDKGICKKCIEEDKNDKEATVSWSEYNSDHIIAYIKGGKTEIPQGQVLCRYHNIQKKDKDV